MECCADSSSSDGTQENDVVFAGGIEMMKKLLIATLVLLSSLVNRQASADVSVQLVSTWSNGKPIHSVAVRGNCAYVGTEDSLIALDVSDPSLPRLIKELLLGPGINRTIRDIALSGNYAYLGATTAGIYIIDISEPYNPALVSHWDPPCPPSDHGPYGIAVQGKYVYTSELSYGLRVSDFTDLLFPKEIARYNPEDVTHVAVSGNYAYLCHSRCASYWGGHIDVLDISDPEHPNFCGRCVTAACPYGVAVSDVYAYIADSGYGLFICDVSNPYNPTPVGKCTTPGSGGYRVAVSGNYAYLADGAKGLTVVDISDPYNPRVVYNYDTAGNASSIAVAGNYVYLTQGGEGGVGLLIFRIGPEGGVTIRGTVYDASTTDMPLGDVNISAGSRETQTDGSGEYEITGLTPGQIKITARKGAYQMQTQTIDFAQVWQTYTIDFQLVPEGVVVFDTGFRPSKNGFHFCNKPQWWIFGGYCTGMTYAALNYWSFRILPTPAPDPINCDVWPPSDDPQRRDIERLQNKYAADASFRNIWKVMTGLGHPPDGWIDEVYANLIDSLNNNEPKPLVLGRLAGSFPHCVLAYKVVERGNYRSIFIYDNNYRDMQNIITLENKGSSGGPDLWIMQPYGDFLSLITVPNIYERYEDLAAVVKLSSPAVLKLVDPNGLVIDKERSEVKGGYYRVLDTDGDGHEEHLGIILWPKEGQYSVQVIPDPNADPNETYTLEEYKFGEKTVLADNIKIQDIPAEAYKSVIVFPTISCEQALTLLDYQLVERERMTRTEFEYTFRLHAANSWVFDLKDVIVQLVQEPNNTTVLDDTVKFSLIKAGTEALSDDTFKILTDRAIEGSPSDVVWKICDCKMHRRSDFSHDWSVDFRDFSALAEAWLNFGDNMPQDVYPDGTIDVMDLMIFSEEWLR